MDRLDRYKVFIQVAEMGSFIRAAHALAIPRASVSAAIHLLESQLGTRLLHRTTRKVSLTPDGLVFLARVRGLLSAAQDLEQMFHDNQIRVRGRLNIDVPNRIARRLLAPALPALGVDCAIRVGALADSSLVVRALGYLEIINCASPVYLAEHREPRTIEELTHDHLCIGYGGSCAGHEQLWEYLHHGELDHLSLPCRVMVNNAESYIACCLAGIGLIQIPRFDVQHLLDSGQLQEVLPAFRPKPMPISLVYPHRYQRSHRLHVFMEWFEALIESHVIRR
jgi:DNA-binding transcriptional LysR family regulator